MGTTKPLTPQEAHELVQALHEEADMRGSTLLRDCCWPQGPEGHR